MAQLLPIKSLWMLSGALLFAPWIAGGCAAGGRGESPHIAHVPRVQHVSRTPVEMHALPGESPQQHQFSHLPAVRQADWSDAPDPGSPDPGSPDPGRPAPGHAVQVEPPTASIRSIEFQSVDALSELVQLAQAQNPRLRGLQQEVAAAQARVSHVDKLPDPTVGANIYASPIETAAGSQNANMTVAQRFPWLYRLDAQVQQACFEALAVEQVYESARLKVIADVRASWFRLYVLGKQIEINQANQELLQSLIKIANARVATGGASQGDVLLGTLELSRLAEQLLTLRQQRESARAELNRLVGRPSDQPISMPTDLAVSLPAWSHDALRQLAIEQQPDIAAAYLRAEASRWGVEVARLRRRPDISLSASWFAINDDRPTPNIVDVGRDAWSVGVQLSVPIWHHKYNAIEEEATQRQFASNATIDDAINRYDALLRDLWEKARAASETSELYLTTILPQAEQTLKADQESYSNGNVEFDRVILDLRNLLTLQLEHHRAVGRLAIALARIQQATGTDLPIAEAEPEPLPAP